MKTILNKLFFIVFILFFIQIIKAQDPNWSVNSANYQYSMTFTAFLNVNGITLNSSNDKVAVFVNGEIRGVSNVVYVANANKYVTYLSVYANTDKETLEFKIYNSTTGSVINIDKTEVFTIDGNIGGIFQSYSIASPQLNKNAVFNSFNFLGITSIVSDVSSDKINIVLPENTNLTSLTAVFDISVNSKVFIDGVLQTSGSSLNDFTNAIIYKVLSENEATLTVYEVIVSTALNNNPTKVVISTTKNMNSNSVPFSLDIAFSKVVSGFEKSDFLLENGVVSSFTTSDSQNYQVEVIPFLQGSFSVQIPASVTLDANNNENEVSNKVDLNYDLSKPLINHISVESNVNSWWFLVTFNEEVVNVNSSDFELKGVASSGLVISSVNVFSSKQYNVHISNSNTDIGAISLQLKSTNDIKDVVGNSVVNSKFEAYFLNNKVLATKNSIAKNDFMIYPNPASDFINIHLKEGILEHVLMYELNGKEVFSKTVKNQDLIIDVNKLKNGVYFMKIISNKGILNKKWIIN